MRRRALQSTMPAPSAEISRFATPAALARQRGLGLQGLGAFGAYPREIQISGLEDYPREIIIYDAPLGALGFSFKKAFRGVKKVAKATVRAPVGVAKATVRMPLRIGQAAVRGATRATTALVRAPVNVAKATVRPLTSSITNVVRNPLSLKNWANVAIAPIKSTVKGSIAIAQSGAAVAQPIVRANVDILKAGISPVVAAAQPLRVAADVTDVTKRITQATRVIEKAAAPVVNVAIMAGSATGLVPVPKIPETERLVEDTAAATQAEVAADALSVAAENAMAAGDTGAAQELADRANTAAAQAEVIADKAEESRLRAIQATGDSAVVTAAVEKTREVAAAEAQAVVNATAQVALAREAQKPMPVTGPQKPSAAGPALGVGAGALIGTAILPGIGTAVGAAAGWLLGRQAAAKSATAAIAGLGVVKLPGAPARDWFYSNGPCPAGYQFVGAGRSSRCQRVASTPSQPSWMTSFLGRSGLTRLVPPVRPAPLTTGTIVKLPSVLPPSGPAAPKLPPAWWTPPVDTRKEAAARAAVKRQPLPARARTIPLKKVGGRKVFALNGIHWDPSTQTWVW